MSIFNFSRTLICKKKELIFKNYKFILIGSDFWLCTCVIRSLFGLLLKKLILRVDINDKRCFNSQSRCPTTCIITFRGRLIKWTAAGNRFSGLARFLWDYDTHFCAPRWKGNLFSVCTVFRGLQPVRKSQNVSNNTRSFVDASEPATNNQRMSGSKRMKRGGRGFAE